MKNIDWQKVTINLRAKYKPLSQVAKEVNSDWQHMNRLARGETKEPKFSVGLKLLELHYQHCPDRHNMKFIKPF